MSRRALEQAVDELAEAHSGAAFADAVRRYAEGLDEAQREELKAILVERANVLGSAVQERFRVRGWFARTLERLDELERRPPRPGNPRDR